MIDITREEVITLAEAARRLPCRRKGKSTNVATLYRWASTGLHGERLEVIRVGGGLCTSAESLQRFFNRLTNRHEKSDDVATIVDLSPNDSEIERQLDDYGV
jgi:hypothetical protein